MERERDRRWGILLYGKDAWLVLQNSINFIVPTKQLHYIL